MLDYIAGLSISSLCVFTIAGSSFCTHILFISSLRKTVETVLLTFPGLATLTVIPSKRAIFRQL